MTWLAPQEFLQTVPHAVHGAFVILTDEYGRVLLLHDAHDEGRALAGWGFYWWPSGGILDLGESPSEGARREAAEETGLNLGKVTCLGADFRRPTKDWPAVTNYYFTAAPLTDAQTTSIRLTAEHDAHQFVHPEQCPELVSPSRMSTLSALLAARATGTTCFLEGGRPM